MGCNLSFEMGFLRVAQAEPDLVGKEYEENEDGGGLYGFSSHLTANPDGSLRGCLFWNRLWKAGGYEDTIEYIHFATRQRYKWEDPKLVPIGTPSPLAGEKPPVVVPGPEPPPAQPESKPPSKALLISDYAGGKTLGENQAALDAFLRAVDAARKLPGPITIQYGPGAYWFAPYDASGLNVAVAGAGIDSTAFRRPPNKPQAMFKNFQSLSDFGIEGDSRKTEAAGQGEIELWGQDQRVTRVKVHDFRWLGIVCKGTNPVIDTCKIVGTSPGGNIDVGNNNISFFGCWSEEYWKNDRSQGVQILNTYFTGMGLNAMFLGHKGGQVKGCKTELNHYAVNPQGFGGGELCLVGSGIQIIENDIGPADNANEDRPTHAGGLELDGTGHYVARNKVHGHAPLKEIICQKGVQTVEDNDIYDAQTGISIENESKNSVVVLSGDKKNRFRNCKETVWRAP